MHRGDRWMSYPDNLGIQLLKKGKKGMRNVVFSRLGLIILLLGIQVYFLLGVFQRFELFLPHFFGGSVLFSLIMVLFLLNGPIDPTAKITWLAIIMLLPVFGALLFLFTQSDLGHRALKRRHQHLVQLTGKLLTQDANALNSLRSYFPGPASLVDYVNRNGCCPVYTNTQVNYFPIGEAMFEEMLVQLERAEHFIFLEYFIVDEGLMWGRILEILAQKAAQGVEVRMMYDGTCEFAMLPHNYPHRLKALGIHCKMFAPVMPFVSTHYNYRDHRKILVIDGHTAFTGGINLADEYINRIVRFGHWKDTGVMLQGEAARSFTLMFLQMWNIDESHPVFDRYLNFPFPDLQSEKGYVLPYGDCPLDRDKVGERVYMDILNRALRYVHIMSPYLILDGEMETALKFAAERGVDVRLILPGIPDKRIPYALARTHYVSLLRSGVQIYEYTPGFVHAKIFVCDDREAVVGTINLDYRSLYHHFECATYMVDVACISEIETDFVATQKKCTRVTLDSLRHENPVRKITGCLMKLFAPLL